MMNSIFKNLKIIELSSVLAGPLCGSFFAELGAEVIKVENKTTGGDVTRTWKVAGENPASPLGSYYAAANYGKTVWSLNLNDAKDYQKLQQAISTADVVISNYKLSTAQKYELTYEHIKQNKADVIFAQLFGFEETDNRGAYDAVLQAEAGFMFMNGTAETMPVKIPFAIVDVLSNHQMREAILIALLKKAQTGKGAWLKISMLKAAVSALINQASNYLMNGNIPEKIGSAHPSIAPYGDTFSTKDNQYIVLAVGTDKQFTALCNLLQIPQVAKDVQFNTNPNRVLNRPKLVVILHQKITTLYAKALMADLVKNQVPAGLIKNMKQVFQHPIAQGMVKECLVEDILTKRVSTVAFEIS